MTDRMRNAYRRAVAFLKPQLQQGSTVRALLFAVTPAGVVGGTINPDHLAIGMLVAGLIAAIIPDEL